MIFPIAGAIIGDAIGGVARVRLADEASAGGRGGIGFAADAAARAIQQGIGMSY